MFCAAYVVGSLNSAIITTYLIKRKDIRKYGSFNAGLTNVYRCFGVKTAAATLVMDLLKGAVVVFGTRLVMLLPIFDGFILDSTSVCLISMVFAVLGHCFPAFYGFKGGKGILIGGVCAMFIDPPSFLLSILVFVIAVAVTKYISVGSMSACAAFPIFTMLWQAFANRFLGASYVNIHIHGVLALGLFIIGFLRHFSNIQHLFSGEEKKFYLHKKGEDE